jgi:hypothetical protein
MVEMFLTKSFWRTKSHILLLKNDNAIMYLKWLKLKIKIKLKMNFIFLVV